MNTNGHDLKKLNDDWALINYLNNYYDYYICNNCKYFVGVMDDEILWTAKQPSSLWTHTKSEYNLSCNEIIIKDIVE